jgi:predicted nucleotidyltransferase
VKVAGIIAEYNPMHSGHIYHLQQTKDICKADFVVAVMSGNFTQRGEPAIYDKWLRAAAAVKNGVDLVLELPFAYACNSAAYFGTGAVNILDGLGCVTHLCFGSETGQIQPLLELATFLADEPNNYKDALKRSLDKGLSFPTARESALTETYGKADALKLPNNILGIEYLKALIQLKSKIEPVTIIRKGQGHHESASEIRKTIIWDESKYFDMIRQAFIKSQWGNLDNIFGAAEGIQNKIVKNIRSAKDLDDLIDKVKTKRYTWTGINRLLAQTLVGFTAEEFQQINGTRYGRILAFNENGAKLLRRIKKTECATMPILTNINRDLDQHPGADGGIKLSLAKDVLASDLYNLAFSKDLYKNSDFVVKPAYVHQL